MNEVEGEGIDGEPLDEDEVTEDFIDADEDCGILNPAPDVEFAEPLRPQPAHDRTVENNKAIGGMRRPRRAVEILGLRSWGRKVRRIFDTFVKANPHLVNACL